MELLDSETGAACLIDTAGVNPGESQGFSCEPTRLLDLGKDNFVFLESLEVFEELGGSTHVCRRWEDSILCSADSTLVTPDTLFPVLATTTTCLLEERPRRNFPPPQTIFNTISLPPSKTKLGSARSYRKYHCSYPSNVLSHVLHKSPTL